MSRCAPRVEPLASDLLDPPLKERVRRRLAAWLERPPARACSARSSPCATRRSPARRAASRSPRRVPGHRAAASCRTAGRRAPAGGPQGAGRDRGRDRTRGGVRRRSSGRRRLACAGSSGRSEKGASFPPCRWPSVDRGFRTPRPTSTWRPGISPGRTAVRVDRLERVSALAYRRASGGPFAPGADLASLLGCRVRDVRAVLVALGYVGGADGTVALRRDPAQRQRA